MSAKVKVYKQEKVSYETLRLETEKVSEYLFGDLRNQIQQGMTVVLKPNFVKESHMRKPNDWDYVITHTEIIRLVLGYVVDRLNNNGKVYIVDAPQTDSDYDEIIKRVKLKEIVEEARNHTSVVIEYFDLREERWFYKDGIIVSKKKLRGDPNGYVKINLKDKSEFYGKENKQFYGADYDMNETAKYHNETDNIYIVSKTILSADVFINLPKLKTHKLGGVTCCLKNLVGTCVVKNSIPHHTVGAPENGGDKFEHLSAKNDNENKLKALALRILKYKNPIINYPFILIKKLAGLYFGSPKEQVIRNGMWYGNDTIWRSTLDLNKILLYADKNGVMQETVQRGYFAVVDGIYAGENNGPMEPDKKETGILISGDNPAIVDTAAATLMGFDYKKIPSIFNAFRCRYYSLTETVNPMDIKVESNYAEWNKHISEFKYDDTLKFVPHFGWKGHIEL